MSTPEKAAMIGATIGLLLIAGTLYFGMARKECSAECAHYGYTESKMIQTNEGKRCFCIPESKGVEVPFDGDE